MTTDQHPLGGCENCGGEVRTRKPGYGWVCSKCVKQLDADPLTLDDIATMGAAGTIPSAPGPHDQPLPF